MTRVLRREQVRELDRRAIEEFGVPSAILMENASRACADVACRMLGAPVDAPALVFCGPGNNGGDGLAIARTLVNRGYEARAVLVVDPGYVERAAGDVALQLHLWRGLGRGFDLVAEPADLHALAGAVGSAPLLIDALFGTGLTRPLEGLHAAAVEGISSARRPVLAVDLPSGLDADTGEVLGRAVRADATVTFVARKPGLLAGRGPELAGRVVVAEIGIPRPLLDAD